MGAEQLTRRRFVQGLAAGGAVAGLGRWEALARAARPEPAELRGTSLDLVIGETRVNITGASRDRPDHQRLAARAAPALARRRDGRPSRQNDARRGCVDSLARPHPAGQHGRRAGPELPRHPSGRDLHLQDSGSSSTAHTGTTATPGSRSSVGSMARSSSSRASPTPFTHDREHVVLLSDWTDENPERVSAS